MAPAPGPWSLVNINLWIKMKTVESIIKVKRMGEINKNEIKKKKKNSWHVSDGHVVFNF